MPHALCRQHLKPPNIRKVMAVSKASSPDFSTTFISRLSFPDVKDPCVEVEGSKPELTKINWHFLLGSRGPIPDKWASYPLLRPHLCETLSGTFPGVPRVEASLSSEPSSVKPHSPH